MGLTKKRTKINFKKEGKHGGSDGGLAPKSSPTPATPWTVAARLLCPWDFRQEYWNGLLFPPPRDLLNPEIQPASPALQVVSCIAGRLLHCKWILYCWATREAQGKHDRESRGKPFKHGSLKTDNHWAILTRTKRKWS